MNPRFRISDWILIIAFLALLVGMLVGTFFSWDFYKVQDNRGLAKKPDLASLKLVQIPAKFEAYLNDHFGFRNALIRRYNKLLNRYFGGKSSKVTLGKRKWLFSSKTIPDYLGYARTRKEDLERWRLILEGKRAWLAEKGICYIFVVPRNKATIYSEYLPEEIALGKGETLLQSLLAYMKDKSDVPILDLTPALLKEKKQRQIYFSGDSHWNAYGCFVGYRQLILSMKNCLTELSDPMPFDPQWIDMVPVVGGLIHMGGLDKDDYREVGPCLQFGRLPYVYKQVKIQDDWVIEALTRRHGEGSNTHPMHTYNHENELRAVIFHDSFMVAIPTFLARHFAQVENLWLRSNYNLLEKAVESYHPDVVIDEVQERFLYEIPEDHPEWVAARERYASKRLAGRE